MTPTRCAACRYLRRRCPPDCIFSPYFPSNDPQRFEYVHRIYGASNISKMLKDERIQVDLRGAAADCLHYEAQCRIHNPVYGCVGYITALDQHIQNVEIQLEQVRAELTVLRARAQLQHQTQYQQVDDQIQGVPSFNYNLLAQQNIEGQSLHGHNANPWL